jgi:hypothetical protein
MSDLKWADVAHYYPIILYGVHDPHFVETDEHGHTIRGHAFAPSLPILRHLEDMTVAEFTILAKRKYGKGNARDKKVLEQLKAATKVKFLYHFKDRKYISFSYYPAPGLSGEANIYYHDFLTALQLIEWGFDLFGFIESGEAIRKEAPNG